MGGLFPMFFVFAASIATVFGLAILLVAGALAAAALLPRGHLLADRLRRFAGEVPRLGWRAVLFLDGFVFVGAMALFALLTIKFA